MTYVGPCLTQSCSTTRDYDLCNFMVTGMPSMSPVRVIVLPCIA